jgi:hypothetical protein
MSNNTKDTKNIKVSKLAKDTKNAKVSKLAKDTKNAKVEKDKKKKQTKTLKHSESTKLSSPVHKNYSKTQSSSKSGLTVCQYKNCDISNLIMKYLIPLMQLVSVEIPGYNMELRTTKCLNTAVMLTYILSDNENKNKNDNNSKNKSESLKKIEYCSVTNTNDRYDKLNTNELRIREKQTVFNKLKKDITETTDQRYFYYILITNNTMEKGDKIRDNSKYDNTQFFPGHVFIIDTDYDCDNKPIHKVYQSYINQYDLKGHYKHNNNNMNLQKNDINIVLDGIENIISGPVWNEDSRKFWKNFTYVDTKKLLHYSTDKFNLCYSRIKMDYCYTNLYHFIYHNLLKMNKKIKEGTHNYYQVNQANNNTFKVKQLDIYELYNKLSQLYKELDIKVRQSESNELSLK